MRTPPTFTTGVCPDSIHISRSSFRLPVFTSYEVLSCFADIGILILQIEHVLPATDVLLRYSLLLRFIVRWLDVSRQVVRFQVGIVLFTLIASISHDILQRFTIRGKHLFQERFQSMQVIGLLTTHNADDEGSTGGQLDIVGRLELSVEHVVRLHAYEGCIVVSLGITVSASHDLEMVPVGREPFHDYLQFLIISLLLGFPPANAMGKHNPVSAAKITDFVEPGFHALIQHTTFWQSERADHLIHELLLVLFHRLTPDKAIPVRGGLDLRPIDIQCLQIRMPIFL